MTTNERIRAFVQNIEKPGIEEAVSILMQQERLVERHKAGESVGSDELIINARRRSAFLKKINGGD